MRHDQPPETITLNKIMFSVAHATGLRELPNGTELILVFEPKLQQIVMQIQYFLAGREYDPWELKVPANWWQHFRERWCPAWWLKYFPVEHTVHRLKIMELFPNIALPDRREFVEYAKIPPTGPWGYDELPGKPKQSGTE